MTRQVQKQEAIKRMKMLKLHENVVREFRDEDVLNLSEHGMLFWLNDKQQEYVRDFENEHNAVVYHVIHDFTEFGELLTFLYVSKYEEEWENDRKELTDGYSCAYVKNLDDDMCSEFGGICILPRYSGVLRIA